MADISNVSNSVIKEIYQRLESLSCMGASVWSLLRAKLTAASSYYDKSSILKFSVIIQY